MCPLGRMGKNASGCVLGSPGAIFSLMRYITTLEPNRKLGYNWDLWENKWVRQKRERKRELLHDEMGLTGVNNRKQRRYLNQNQILLHLNLDKSTSRT